MKNIDVRKLSPQERKLLRQMVVRLWKQSGMPIRKLSQTVGVHFRTLETWLSRASQEGDDLLEEKKRGRPVGACRKLTLADETWLRETIVKQMPQQMQLPCALWSYSAIGALVKERLGIEMRNRLIAKYLKRWGFTIQRPIDRDLEQRSEEIDTWLKQTFPGVRARARAEGALIYWADKSVVEEDESWVRDDTSCDPLSTPTLMDRLSMITLISPRGEIAFQIIEGSLDAERFREFLAILIENSLRKIYLVVDNLYIYHARLKAWLEENADRIELIFLPPYAPHFDPDDVEIDQSFSYPPGS